jgi:hypothetical protein
MKFWSRQFLLDPFNQLESTMIGYKEIRITFQIVEPTSTETHDNLWSFMPLGGKWDTEAAGRIADSIKAAILSARLAGDVRAVLVTGARS